jgi:hypothetical protein
LSSRQQVNLASSRAILSWMEAAWLPLTVLMAVTVAVLNAHAAHNFHTIEKHLVFRERILHGFATTVVMPGYPTPPTFPMWGYGWVLLLTTNKMLLIALQLAVAIGTMWYFMRVVERSAAFNRWARPVLRLLILVCTPWYAYHSIDWSQSLATSFFILSIASLVDAANGDGKPWRLIALSAIAFGLSLNMASDFYLLPVAIAALAAGTKRWSRIGPAHALVWLGGIAVMLAPWMAYTWHATGVPLLTSTNQGHVLFIGLGQDPSARFGVTYSDGDPAMHEVVRNELGDDFANGFYATCSFEADPVIRNAFLSIVKSRPRDYLDLVLFKLRRILAGAVGTYGGEFDEGQNAGRFGIGQQLRRLVRQHSERVGRQLQLATTGFAPLVLFVAVRRRQPMWAFIAVPIVYQYLSCAIAVVQPQYLASVIVLQFLICAQGAGLVLSRIEQAWAR